MTSIETLLWTEKYRPRTLDEIGMSEENRALLGAALDAGEIPHLLLHGPAGCGKTTLAFVVRDALDCQTLVLNASKDRGLDVVRNHVDKFVRGNFGARWNLVILDEADYLTREAQTALRNLMETYAHRARFVLTANYLRKILDPIQSRCVDLRLAEMEVRDRARVLLRVLDAEGVDADPEVVGGYARTFTDLRRMLNAAQRSVTQGGGTLGPCAATSEEDGRTLLSLVGAGDYKAVREIAKQPGADHAELLRAMFWAVEDDDPGAATLRFRLAQAYDASPGAPDPVVHFLGTAAELCQ